MLSIQIPSDSPCSSEVSATKRSNERALDELCLEEADLPTSTLDQLDLLGFSIRGYVCQARTKSIKQNWPFPSPYLQFCLDHGVKNVLPPFEPSTSFKPWHLLNSDVLRTEVTGEAVDVEDDVCGGLRRISATCVDQLGARSKQEESTSSRPSSSHKGMLDSISTITNDDFMRETLLPPKFLPVGRRKHSAVGAAQPAPSCKSKSPSEVDEICGPKPAKKRGDQISVTVSKECSEMKPETGKSEGFVSKLSALLDPMASKICPVCRNFSSTSNTTLNAHIDQCLASDSTTQLPLAIKQRRHKVKPRKMKSIAEIYETARPCTLEHFDRMNETTVTQNNCMVPLASEDFRESKRARPPEVNSADESDVDAVNVDSSGRKVRMLSQLTAEEGPSSSKHSKGESDERGPLTSNKRSLVFSKSKVSRLKFQGEKLTTMLTDLENQNYELPEGTNKTCEHQKEKKEISLHEKTEEKIRSSGHLKHWVCSKRRVLKRVVCKGKMHVSKDNVVHDGDPSTCTSCNPNSAISMKTFVHSPSEGGAICQDETRAPNGDGSSLQNLSYKSCCPSARKKLLTLRKKFSSKSLGIAKKVSKSNDVEEPFPREYQEEQPSKGCGKQMEQVRLIDNRCSRTCNSSDPTTLQAGKETCGSGCSKDPLETKNSKLEKHLSLVEDTALDSEEKLNNKDPLTVKKPLGPNDLPHGAMHHADGPLSMHFDGAKGPDSDEVTLDVHNLVAPTAYNIGDPTKKAPCSEMATVSAECHLESPMEDGVESFQSELSREDISFSNQGSNKASYDTSQTVDEKNDDKSKHNAFEAEAFISQVNTSICQGKGENFTYSQENVFSDAFLGKSSVEQNSQLNLGCPNFTGSEYQCKLFDMLAAQGTPASTRLGTRVSTVIEPVFRAFEPLSCCGQSKMNLSSQCEDSDSTRIKCDHFFQDHQLASPNGIPGRHNINPDLRLEASMAFTGTQPFHVNETSCCQGYHTSSTDQQTMGICCRGFCAVSAGQQILAQNSNSYQLLIDGCVHGENRFLASTCHSDPAPKVLQNLQAATADKMDNIFVHSPFLGAPTKSPADAIQTPHGGTASQVSDQCKVQPTANCVLRLMGKNLMVANQGEVNAVQHHVNTPCKTTDHPNYEYVRNLGFPGTCGCKPNQLLSNPSVQEDPFVFTHFQHETLSTSRGKFGNPRIHPVPTQPKNYCSVHNDNHTRFSLQTVFDAKSENQFQHRTLFQSCGQLNSFKVQNLEFAHKLQQEAFAHFGVKAAQEVITLDDSPEPCRSE